MDTLQRQCCHAEGLRHQVTRFALEKALKLSEVLMQEIARLDRTVKRQQLRLNELDPEELAPLQEDLRQETLACSGAKKSLLSDIHNLNAIAADCDWQAQGGPELGKLRGLYLQEKDKSIKPKAAGV